MKTQSLSIRFSYLLIIGFIVTSCSTQRNFSYYDGIYENPKEASTTVSKGYYYPPIDVPDTSDFLKKYNTTQDSITQNNAPIQVTNIYVNQPASYNNNWNNHWGWGNTWGWNNWRTNSWGWNNWGWNNGFYNPNVWRQPYLYRNRRVYQRNNYTSYRNNNSRYRRSKTYNNYNNRNRNRTTTRSYNYNNQNRANTSGNYTKRNSSTKSSNNYKSSSSSSSSQRRSSSRRR